MKFLVFSDSHGNFNKMYQAAVKHKDIDTVFFLGDGADDIQTLSQDIDKKIFAVRGNCDRFSGLLSSDIYIYNSLRILFTHGDEYKVKGTLLKLSAAAENMNINLVLYGHTHIADLSCVNDIILFNPGSISNGQYGIIEIIGKQIKTYHLSL